MEEHPGQENVVNNSLPGRTTRDSPKPPKRKKRFGRTRDGKERKSPVENQIPTAVVLHELKPLPSRNMSRPKLLRKTRDLLNLKDKYLDEIDNLKSQNSQLRRDLYDKAEQIKFELADHEQKIDELTKTHTENLHSLQANHDKIIKQKDATI